MKNFVFDLYGTLVNIKTDENSPAFIKSMQKYFGSDDFPERYKTLCSLLEKGEEYCEIDLIKVFEKLAPGNAQRAADFFRRKSRKRLRLYRGVRGLLKKLKAKGAKLYLLSNAQACFTVNELKKLRIYGLFDGIELSSDFGKKKPSAEFFGHIIAKYALDRGNTVYVGNDFNSDILGAKKAGLNAVYIKSNCSPQGDSLNKIFQVADFATDSFKKLSGYLLSL